MAISEMIYTYTFASAVLYTSDNDEVFGATSGDITQAIFVVSFVWVIRKFYL